MELNDYQKKAMTTCMESSENFSYMMLNLVGEVGEFASKVAKSIRKGLTQVGCRTTNDDDVDDSDNDLQLSYPYTEEKHDAYNILNEELRKEAGDILWQLSGLCSVMGWSLESIAQMNLDKLASRQQRNVIDGNGDNR